jgi:hypothetical protein
VAEDGPRFLGYLQDVSVTGAFVQSCAPRPPGTCLSIRLRLPGLATPLECSHAEVVWSRPYQGRGGPAPGMGVRLEHLGACARAHIRKFCTSPQIQSAPARAVAPANAVHPARPGMETLATSARPGTETASAAAPCGDPADAG